MNDRDVARLFQYLERLNCTATRIANSLEESTSNVVLASECETYKINTLFGNVEYSYGVPTKESK
jgi:hypothetical protein